VPVKKKIGLVHLPVSVKIEAAGKLNFVVSRCLIQFESLMHPFNW